MLKEKPNKGISSISIIIALIIVGLLSGGLYFYLQKKNPENLSEKEEQGEKKESLSWEEIYGPGLHPSTKDFLNKVFQETDKYPTKESTKEEKQFYLEKCDEFFTGEMRQGCYSNMASFTEDEDICEKMDDPSFCIFNIAVDKKDLSICEKIKEGGIWTSEKCKELLGTLLEAQ